MPAVAKATPAGKGGYTGRRTSTESQIKRFCRWLKSEDVTHAIFFLPSAQQILRALSHTTLVLVIDGTVVGRGCLALVVAVVFKQRALPMAWLVEKTKKGQLQRRAARGIDSERQGDDSG